MASKVRIVVFGMLLMACVTMGAAPRKPVDVPFGRNYMPTWAFDHIKYFNGGSEIKLHLDKYTGTHIYNISIVLPILNFCKPFKLVY